MLISKSLSNKIIFGLSCLGCLVTIVLIFEHFRPNYDLGCSVIGGDCAAISQSEYGHLGPIPTAVFGFGMYVCLIALTVMRKKLLAANVAASSAINDISNLETGAETSIPPSPTPSTVTPSTYLKRPINCPERQIDLVVWMIAAPAVCTSIWLQKIALFDLIKFCPWCFSSAILVTIIFLLASKDLFLDRGKLEGEQKLLVATLGLISFLGAIMLGPGLWAQFVLATHIKIKPPHSVTQSASTPLVSKDANVTGAATARYTVVEFADYQCQHCGKAASMMNQLLKDNPTKYRLVFRNYPLPNHTWANRAACAAEAAGLQGKFWEMHDYIFEHQSDFDKKEFRQEDFKQFGEAVGVDPVKLYQDMQSDKILSKVAKDAHAGQVMDVKMTPTFFVINGKNDAVQYSGIEQLKQALDNPSDKVWQ